MRKKQAFTIAVAAILVFALSVFAVNAQARTTTHKQVDTETQFAASLVTEPPEPLEFVDQIGGRITALEIQGDYLYAGIGPRLVILDVSDPTEPQRVGQTEPLPGAIERLSVQDDLVFSANGEGGLRIIDVENPAAPQEIGFYSGNVSDVESDVDVAFLVSTDGLSSIDTSDPTSPQQLDFLEMDLPSWNSEQGHIALDGNIISYVSGIYFWTINVSNPTKMEIFAEIELDQEGVWNTFTDVVTAEGFSYLAQRVEHRGDPHNTTNSYVVNYDISDPANPIRKGRVETGSWSILYSEELNTGLAFADNTLYVTSAGELNIIDVSDPSNPVIAGLYDTPIPMAVAAEDITAYVSSYVRGIEVVDVQHPSQATHVATYAIVPELRHENIGFDDPYLYVSDAAGFSVIRFTRRNTLELVSAFHSEGSGPLDYQEDYVYLGGGGGFYSGNFTRLRIVDVSNRAQPFQTGYADDEYSGPALTVNVKGDYAFVSNDDVLPVFDVSNPESPEVVDRTSCGMGADDAKIQDDTLYIAGNFYNLCIFDITHPDQLVLLGYYGEMNSEDWEGSADYVYVRDHYAWLSINLNQGGYELSIIDVENPAVPQKAGKYKTTSLAKVIDMIGNQAFVADGNTLLVLDISDPIHPVNVASYELFAPATRVRQIGAYMYVYVADDQRGLWVYRTPVDGGPRTVESQQTDNPPTIDGDLSDWPVTSGTAIDLPTARNVNSIRPSTADVSASIRSLWTDSMLYFAMEIIDNKLVADSEKVWEDDAIEIALDALFDHLPGGVDDHQYTTTVDGRTADFGSPDESYVAAIKTRIDGWDLEVAIPVGNFGLGSFNEGDIMGLNLGLIDDDTGGDYDSYLLWESDRTWETMPDWGQLHLTRGQTLLSPSTPGVPTPTSTPVGDTFTFQEGFLGYSGAEDAAISQWHPTINYGSSYTVTVRGDGAIGTLLQYDLSTLPDDIAIKRATLSLYPQERSNPQALDASVYPLLRGWGEAQATWEQASNGNSWQVPGADGVTDRERVATDHKIIDWLQFWASFDLTELVQRWVDGDLANNGVVVKQIGGPAVGYDFTSRDVTHWEDTPYRPELIISYWNATPTATPSPTSTPTPTITPSPTPPCLDAYEPDDTWQQAHLIFLDGEPQQHNFHQPGDVDYVKFGVTAGMELTLYTDNLGSGVDTTLTLYDSDGVTQLAYNDIDPLNPPASRIDWTAPASGTYFLKAAHFNAEAGGCDMTYELAVERTGLTPTPVSLYLPLMMRE